MYSLIVLEARSPTVTVPAGRGWPEGLRGEPSLLLPASSGPGVVWLWLNHAGVRVCLHMVVLPLSAYVLSSPCYVFM